MEDAGVTDQRFVVFQTSLLERLQSLWKGAGVDRKFAEDALNVAEGEEHLSEALGLATRLAPLLAHSSRILGNPRIVKRLLNTIRIRKQIATQRGMPIDEALIAKIAILERCTTGKTFSAFCGLVNSAGSGKPTILTKLEKNALDDKKFEGLLPADFKTDQEFLKEWILLPPSLDEMDLRPAVYLSRDTSTITASVIGLSVQGEAALRGLAEVASLSSPAAKKLISELPLEDLDVIAEELIGLLRKTQDWESRPRPLKRETVIEKIAAQAMAADISLSPSCIGWLDQRGYIETSYDTEAVVILIRWQEWQNKLRASPSRIASSPNHQAMEQEFGELLSSHQSIVDDAEKLISTLRNCVLEWPEDLFEQLASWGVWLESQDAVIPSEDEKIKELQAQKGRQSDRLGQTLSAGEIEGQRLRILQEHSDFVNKWCSSHENLCFVCETNLEERGGLQKVFSDTQEKSDNHVKSLRDEFRRIKGEIVKLDDELSSLGVSTPPISSEDQSEIIRLLGWIFPKGVSIKTLLSDPNSRERVFELLQHIKNAPPQNVGSVDVKGATEKLVRVVSGAIKDHTELSLAPSAWQSVQKETISRLSAATSEFLPKTTSALWLEIAKNLMPAPWQYPGELSLAIDETSKSPAAVVSISNNKRNTLANYILNGAEVHILGVAWFLSNYITKGRFRFPFMVLDDPAVMMDQPTYRDFCRLAETIIRLHKTHSRAFTFVCLLHQDSRAVDLARATSATLHQLKWNRNTPVLGGNYRLEAESVAYPLPVGIFRAG